MSRDFILEKIPRFANCKVTIDGTTYELEMVRDNGCHVNVSEDGVLRDRIALTKTDMKAFYVLLTTTK